MMFVSCFDVMKYGVLACCVVVCCVCGCVGALLCVGLVVCEVGGSRWCLSVCVFVCVGVCWVLLFVCVCVSARLAI